MRGELNAREIVWSTTEQASASEPGKDFKSTGNCFGRITIGVPGSLFPTVSLFEEKSKTSSAACQASHMHLLSTISLTPLLLSKHLMPLLSLETFEMQPDDVWK